MNKNCNLCCASVNNVVFTDNNTILNGYSTTYKNIFIYQSISGDVAVGNASFTAKNIVFNIDLNGYKLYVNNTQI